MSSGRIRVLKPEELGEGHKESWRELCTKSRAPANPFLEPEFTLAVGRVRSQARVAVV